MVSDPGGGDAVERSAVETGAWRALEPASLLVNLIPDLWRTARGAWPLLLAVFVGGGIANVVNLLLLASFFAMAVGRTVLHFLTLRYRLHEGKLEIQTGLIGRRFRVIDPARIQNVEIVQNVFHKLAGLVELRIETAGEAGAEGSLAGRTIDRSPLTAGAPRVASRSPP
jgi:putative membrane protein